MTDEASSGGGTPDEGDEPSSGWRAFWNSPTGTGLAALLVAGVGAVMLFGQLSELGIWEPWEANDILVAQEYADREPPPDPEELSPTASSYNWAVPTKDGEPVARSLLKTWLMAQGFEESSGGGEPTVGSLEWSARFPMAAGAWLLVVLGFFWMRRFFGTWAGLLTSLAFVSTPAIYMGAHTVSSELLFVVTTTATVLAYVMFVFDDWPRRWLWGPLFGAGLVLCFVDQRVLGVLVVLAVIVTFGLVQVPFRRGVDVDLDDSDVVGPLQVGLCVLAFAATGGVVAWGFWVSAGKEGTLLLPHVGQILALAVPTGLLLAGAAIAARTKVMSRLIELPGLVGLGIAAFGIGYVVEALFDANPVLLRHGQIVGEIRVLSYLLENHLFGAKLPGGHPHFAMWIRQLGFATVPWAAFIPLGVGYLARSARLTDDDGRVRSDVLSPAASVRRLLLAWGFVAVVIVAAASAFDHYYFPAYFPLLAGVALLFDDVEFWEWARTESLAPYLMGAAAIAIFLMLGKDLERFPARLLEVYMMFEPEVGLPEEFAYGPILDAMKYGWILLAALFFFGLGSWVLLWGKRLVNWRSSFDWLLDDPFGTVADGLRRWWWSEREPDEYAPARDRAIEKKEVRRESGPGGFVASALERPETYAGVLAAAFVATAGIFLFELAPRIGHHLSQRSIFESYTEFADEGETLYRLRVSTDETSVYLRDVESLKGPNDLVERFDEEERFFVVLPRDRVSSVNQKIRREYDRNLPVLNAKSSQIVLASNRLEEDEENENFVAEAIVDGEPSIQHEVTVSQKGDQVHPVFNGRIKLLGYSLDKEGETPTYSWGEKMELTTYYRVERSIPSNQQIFLHIDYPGSRIHGDHYPAGGDFPTSDWLPGDVVKDVYRVQIDNYTSTGTYTIYTGFYRAGRRMQVSPPTAHDGQNRVSMGKIEVTGF